VEFVEVINHQHIKMRVWERGSGETFACGTGACASMYASYLTKRTGDHVKVTLLGGDLNIHLNEDHHIMMEGPATTVFEGEI
jgi:diaminopimelate epimerase